MWHYLYMYMFERYLYHKKAPCANGGRGRDITPGL